MGETGDQPATPREDEEMGLYKKDSRNVITFRIVRREADLEGPPQPASSFKPEMAHQIFGESEMIFGYRHLSVNLWYLHNSAKCFVEVRSSGKIAENDLCKADDVMKALNPWLPEHYRLDKGEFKGDIAAEKHAARFGEVIEAFDNLKVTVCDTRDPDFKQFHQRFETYMIWFIDGANFIDLDDARWTIFYVYEEGEDSVTREKYCSPIAFCTVYKFYLYPNSVRPRVSQFFVLPTHQRKGVGTRLYAAIYKYLRALPEAEDITVEEPTETFQKIRDFCDSLHIYKYLQDNDVNINTQNQKAINRVLKENKICKRQAQRVLDILQCLNSHKNGYKEFVKFTESIKVRIANEIERETRGCKRLCNLERVGVVTEPMDKKSAIDSEYTRYVDSLEWPVNRLRTHLAKISQ